MLIQLTVQSIDYTLQFTRDEFQRKVVAPAPMLFEYSDMQWVKENDDRKLVGNTQFKYKGKMVGVIESLSAITTLVNWGSVKQIETGSASLVADEVTTIAFDNTIGSTSDDFVLSVSCRDSDGNVDYLVENVTSTGFDITAISNCSMSYSAIKK